MTAERDRADGFGGSVMKATDESILEFIREYTKRNGYSPSIREICKAVGIASPGSMKYRLEKLRDMGLVTFVDKAPRTIRVVEA